MTEATTPTGPITIDDVRQALADFRLNPSSTNAGAIRKIIGRGSYATCLLYTSPSPRDGLLSRMPSSA